MATPAEEYMKHEYTPSDMDRFMASLDAPTNSRLWADEVNLEALLRLGPEDRQKVWDILQERLVRYGMDYRLPEALLALDRDRALALFRTAVVTAGGQARVAMARALWRAERDPAVIPALLEVAKAADVCARQAAVSLLGEVDPLNKGVRETLIGALDDPSEDVRAAAARAMLTASPFCAGEWAVTWWGNLLEERLGSPLDWIRAVAIRWYKELSARRLAGKTLEELQLAETETRADAKPALRRSLESPAATRFLDSLQYPPADARYAEGIAVGALTVLEDVEREWADFALCAGLGGEDWRIPRAATQIGLAEAVKPLRGAMKASQGRMRAEAAAALWQLAADPTGRCELERVSKSDDAALRQVASRALQEAAEKKANAQKWQAQLSKYTEYRKDVLKYASPWLVSDQSASQVKAGLDAIYGVVFGYSDRHLDMQAMIPEVFAICMPLVRDLAEFMALCERVPDLVKSLPEESRETPIGYCHSYDTRALKLCAEMASGLNEFLEDRE
jgi:hypothetical protein